MPMLGGMGVGILFDYLLIFSMLTLSGAGILATGLFVMGKPLEIKRIAFLALISAIIMAPVWLLNISNGSKVNLTTFLLMFLLHSKGKYSWFISTGAVLTGLGFLMVLEFAFSFFLNFNPSWTIRVFSASPSTFIGLVLGLIGQSWLEKNSRGNWFDNYSKTVDSSCLRALKIVPLGQLFNAYVLIAVVASTVSWPIFNTFLPILLTGVILIGYYLTKEYFVSPRYLSTPLDFIDLIIIFPVIFYAIGETGGSESPWKVLFILLVITNAFKKRAIFGGISILISGSILFFFGYREVLSAGIWFWELDTLCFLVMISIFILIRRFIYSEKKLKEEVKKTRRALLCSLSHDLKTPMTLVQGYTEVLLQNKLGAENDKKNSLELILEKARDLKRFSQDLFELAQLEAGKIKIKKGEISSEEYLKRIEKNYYLKAGKEEIRFLVEKGKDFNFGADRYLLDRVLANLIFNALNHTPPGGEIKVCISPNEKETEAIFSIKDTGQGIREDELPRIFLRFYRGSERRGEGGKGLGLTIAREIIELHGGKIWVESKKGEGSTFFFSLPIRGNKSRNKDIWQERKSSILNLISLAQLFFIAFVFWVFFFSGFELFPEGSSQPQFLVVFGFFISAGVIPIFLKENSFELKGLSFGLIIDLIILIPLFHLILINTGFSTSPWKLLFIPFIITNTLKEQKYFGSFSVLFSAGSLLIIGFFDHFRGTGWFIEQDLVYITIFVLVNLAITHLKKAQESQEVELTNSGSGFSTQIAQHLQIPLEGIIQLIEGIIKKNNLHEKNLEKAILQVQSKVSQVNKIIEDIFELMQLEEKRAVMKLTSVALQELTEGITEKFGQVKFSFFCGHQPCNKEIFPEIMVDKERIARVLTGSFFIINLFADNQKEVSCSIKNRGDIIEFLVMGEGKERGKNLKEIVETHPLAKMEKTIIEGIMKLHQGNLKLEEPEDGEFAIRITIPVNLF